MEKVYLLVRHALELNDTVAWAVHPARRVADLGFDGQRQPTDGVRG